MRIGINCRSFITPHPAGIGRYAYHLVKNLGEIDEVNRYQLYAKKGLFSFNKNIPRFKYKNFSRRIDFFNKGPAKILDRVDIYHSPSPEILDIKQGVKVIVTIHDLIFKTFPQGHTEETIKESERQFEKIVERADKLICCSRSTLNDLRKYFPIQEHKTAVVYQGVDKELFYPLKAEEENYARGFFQSKGINDAFFLSVGTVEPRKNLENTLKAFHQLKTKKKFQGKLVAAGMRGWMSEGVEKCLEKLDLRNEVIFLGYVSDKELRALYNKAVALIFPSFYEGFGFPIVEAFCCGTPVVTSCVSSCPEVAGDAALTVDPADPEEIAHGLERIVEDPQLREDLRQKGFKRAEDFSFFKTAKETLAVYEEVYSR